VVMEKLERKMMKLGIREEGGGGGSCGGGVGGSDLGYGEGIEWRRWWW